MDDGREKRNDVRGPARILGFLLVYSLWSMVYGLTQVEAGVMLKISASNPSEFSEQEVAIKSYLPKGIQPENVIDAGGLEIGYDVKQGQCYVQKKVVIPMKTTVSYNVEIEDIWLIDKEMLEKYRAYALQLRDQLQDSEYADVSAKLTEGIEQKIESILDKQEANLIEKAKSIEHIGAYEFNKETLAAVKEDLSTLENMIIALMKAGTAAGSKGGKPAVGGKPSVKESARKPLDDARAKAGPLDTEEGAEIDETTLRITELGKIRGEGCLSREALQYANALGISLEQPENVVLNIWTENPSDTEAQTVPIKYSLVEEVKANDVVDAGGLKVGFDFEQSRYYMFKDDVHLNPAEKKTFEVTLRNRWVIDKLHVLTMRVHVEDMISALQGKEGFEKARQIQEDIQNGINQLLERKSGSEFTEDYVVSFREDTRKLRQAERQIEEMESILVDSGVVPAMNAEVKEKLCEQERKKKAVAEASGAQGSEVMKEFKLLAGTIFLGKSASTAAIWKIIFGIIIFLGILSSSFYFIQVKAHQSAMLDPLTGVFSRGYITERFREELRIAKTTAAKCSLLVMDIDKFKSINDAYGHAVGDIILKEFVITIRKGVRATDLVGRFGGDEFLIILPTSDKDRARKIADGISNIVEKHMIKIKDQTFTITTSIGVATFPDDSGTAEDIFVKADGALYQIKRKGGNGVAVV